MITWRNCDARDVGISGQSFDLIDRAKNADKLLSRAAQGAQDSSEGKAEEYHSESVCSWPEQDFILNKRGPFVLPVGDTLCDESGVV